MPACAYCPILSQGTTTQDVRALAAGMIDSSSLTAMAMESDSSDGQGGDSGLLDSPTSTHSWSDRDMELDEQEEMCA